MSQRTIILLVFLFGPLANANQDINGENAIPTTYVSVDDFSGHTHHHIATQKTGVNLEQLPFGWELLSSFDLEKKISSSALSKYLGQKILLKGFMIPLDWEAKTVDQFLLVPYVPSCLHIPLPGENQQILVSLAKGKKTNVGWGPFEISGIIGLNQLKINGEKLAEIDQMKGMPVFAIEAVHWKELTE